MILPKWQSSQPFLSLFQLSNFLGPAQRPRAIQGEIFEAERSSAGSVHLPGTAERGHSALQEHQGPGRGRQCTERPDCTAPRQGVQQQLWGDLPKAKDRGAR